MIISQQDMSVCSSFSFPTWEHDLRRRHGIGVAKPIFNTVCVSVMRVSVQLSSAKEDLTASLFGSLCLWEPLVGNRGRSVTVAAKHAMSTEST